MFWRSLTYGAFIIWQPQAATVGKYKKSTFLWLGHISRLFPKIRDPPLATPLLYKGSSKSEPPEVSLFLCLTKSHQMFPFKIWVYRYYRTAPCCFFFMFCFHILTKTKFHIEVYANEKKKSA